MSLACNSDSQVIFFVIEKNKEETKEKPHADVG